jgi:hypothetical protein
MKALWQKLVISAITGALMGIPSAANTVLAASQVAPAAARPVPESYSTIYSGDQIPLNWAKSAVYGLVRPQADDDPTTAQIRSMRWKSLIRALAIDDKTSQSLMAHIEATIDGWSADSRARTVDFCARQDEFTTAEDIARALILMEEKSVEVRDRFMQGSESILGASVNARLDAYVADSRRDSSRTTLDLIAFARVTKKDPLEWKASICRPLKH